MKYRLISLDEKQKKALHEFEQKKLERSLRKINSDVDRILAVLTEMSGQVKS